MRAFKIHALCDSAKFNLLIILDSLNGNFSAAVTESIINLSETASSCGPLDCITLKGMIAVLVSVSLHFFSEATCPFLLST
jgi:hypothetical protein